MKRLADAWDGVCELLLLPFALLRRRPDPFDIDDFYEACPPAGVRCDQCGTTRGCGAPDA